MMGLNYKSIIDINQEKIDSINGYLEDTNNQKFYTINAEQPMKNLPYSLNQFFRKLINENEKINTDGIFFIEETESYKHVAEINGSHFDVSPFS